MLKKTIELRANDKKKFYRLTKFSTFLPSGKMRKQRRRYRWRLTQFSISKVIKLYEEAAKAIYFGSEGFLASDQGLTFNCRCSLAVTAFFVFVNCFYEMLARSITMHKKKMA